MEMFFNVYLLTAYYLHPIMPINWMKNIKIYLINYFLLESLDSNGIHEWNDFRKQKNIFNILRDKKIIDPHVNWETANIKAPNLSKIALRLLRIPASSAEVERIFSNWSYECIN